MSVKRAVFLTILAVFSGSRLAGAQSPYVGASLFGDIVRTTHTEGYVEEQNPGSGEALGFSLRIGSPIGSNWGVELEYARPSRIKSASQLVYPLYLSPLAEGLPPLSALPGVAPTIYPPPFPIPLAIETRDRHNTLSATLWALQSVSDRFALVYLGGVAFNRFEREYGYTFGGIIPAADPALAVVPLISSRTIVYSTRPVVGLESWIGLTDHVTLTPGVRLHGVQDGWSLRPGIGIVWSF